ncbi:cyclic nucleotide-binding domain-containing protein [Rhizobacter sp. J219]|uniref:Crp/Fnr family transcriptional regulator n=1 Tax=Rhizobacter sp. J219 TaxID=2898430 RepID=UPI002151DEE9|nr:cyclic nucleotide-binding domain-containing protein [Rhizobacter sp. J219]MCR5885921.1 cyclic nucleotide-binding domain-containing protein [Rhizobacter sp. J219]
MHTLASQPLLEHLAGGPLPDWAAFADEVQPRTLAAGDALFETDAPWPWLCVVRRGLFKLAYLREDGSERIKSFIPEGGFFASLAALLPGGRTSFTAVALETSVVEPLSYPRILGIRRAAPGVAEGAACRHRALRAAQGKARARAADAEPRAALPALSA